ncbi:MAG TPA: glycosyltransferase family 39 protein [Candidatus Eisenbacteria bacterium]
MVAATLVAALLRIFHLGHQSLWIDEVFTWNSAGLGSPFALADVLENIHGALYGLIVHLWCGMAGDSEWALRTPSLVAGVLTVPALAWLARDWIGREAMAPAAWLAAGSPYLIWYSQEARTYSQLMLLAVLSTRALLSIRRDPTVRAAVGYAAATGAGLLSGFAFALIAPLHLHGWLAGTEGRGRRLRMLGLTSLALALLALPWVPAVMSTWDLRRLRPASDAGVQGPPLRGDTTFHPGAIPFALHAFAVGYTLGPSLHELRVDPSLRTLARHAPGIAAVTLVFGALGGLGLLALRRRGRLGEAALWLLAPALLVSYFALHNFKVFHPRYLSVALPGFLLVLAAGLAGLGRRARWFLGAAVGALWLVSLFHLYFDPRYGKEDYRGAGALIRARGEAGEKLIAVNSEDPMYYYYRGPLPHDRLWLGFVDRPQRLEQKLGEALQGARGAWVVLSRPEDLDPRGVFARTLDLRFPDAERFAFEGVRVWHIRRS